ATLGCAATGAHFFHTKRAGTYRIAHHSTTSGPRPIKNAKSPARLASASPNPVAAAARSCAPSDSEGFAPSSRSVKTTFAKRTRSSGGLPLGFEPSQFRVRRRNLPLQLAHIPVRIGLLLRQLLQTLQGFLGIRQPHLQIRALLCNLIRGLFFPLHVAERLQL